MPLEERRDPEALVTRADLHALREDVQRQLANGDLRMTSIESELRMNTSVTADIRALLEAGRTGLKVLGAIGFAAQWAAKIGAAVLTLYAAYQAVRHGGSGK
jgi:hypothetical protein